MFCDTYRKALSEAALREERLPAAAQAHLRTCASCREWFSGREALLHRIAGEMRSCANADMPASLLPGIRQQIARTPAARAWRVPVFACVASGLAVGALALSLAVRTKVGPLKPEPSAGLVSSPPPGEILRSQNESRPGPGPAVNRGKERRALRAPANTSQQVLVSGEEQLGLERYAASLRNAAAERTASVKSDAGLEIKPLEIAGMDLKGLSIEPLQGSGDRD